MIRVFTSKKQSFGQMGENAACAFLVKQGFKILERNVPNKFGEIDIVAKKKGIVYFFEVKTGQKGSTIAPEENLRGEKIRRFMRSIEYYCLIKDISDYRAQGIIVLLDSEAVVVIERIDLV